MNGAGAALIHSDEHGHGVPHWANAAHGARASGRVSAVGGTLVLVVATDEELLIACDVAALLAQPPAPEMLAARPVSP